MRNSTDWSGNDVAYIKTNGFANGAIQHRHIEDYYATHPVAVRLLLQLETFSDNIWECAAGEMHLSNELTKLGKKVRSSDLIVRCAGVEQLDFLDISNNQTWCGDIITNPPYKYANDFILKALSLLEDGGKLALFMPIRYLEGKERKSIYTKFPPKTVYISSSRLKCAINGDFDNMTGSAVCYAWFVWVKDFTGTTTLKWFN